MAAFSSVSNGVKHVLNCIKTNGLRKTIQQARMTNELAKGTLLGTDASGNQYYEDLSQIPGRTRYVIYSNNDPNASRVPAEWHPWLHYISDTPPTRVAVTKPAYGLDHQATVLSRMGVHATYVPPGHFLRADPTLSGDSLVSANSSSVAPNPAITPATNHAPSFNNRVIPRYTAWNGQSKVSFDDKDLTTPEN